MSINPHPPYINVKTFDHLYCSDPNCPNTQRRTSLISPNMVCGILAAGILAAGILVAWKVRRMESSSHGIIAAWNFCRMEFSLLIIFPAWEFHCRLKIYIFLLFILFIQFQNVKKQPNSLNLPRRARM